MNQRLTYITLGVSDLETMASFYKEKFGWTPLKEMEGICFFKLNGIILALFPAKELAEDAGIPFQPCQWKQMSFSINFNSEKEVDENINALKRNGVSVIKKPQKVFWGGYSSYFEDPESNLWELRLQSFF
jgi:predicted enzyme related to lactoylglutathione lyase